MIMIGYLLTLLFLPLWLGMIGLCALVSLIVQGRPIFFIQKRAGRNGCPFLLCKLRTMRSGSGSDCERTTRWGSFLRAASLDELPELFNVLRGEMTLVGPRPLPVEYLERYSPEQRRRHEVLPGLTGWAQVNGRNELDWETKFRYDIEYVERRSFFFDLKILFLTVGMVFSARGINNSSVDTMTEFKGSNS